MELLEYASSLSGRGLLVASIGAHLTSCKKCTTEVDAMRRSLDFVAAAPALDVSSELSARIMAGARRELRVQPNPLRSLLQPRRALALCAYLAAVLVVAAVSAAPVWLGYAETAQRASGLQTIAQPAPVLESFPGQPSTLNEYLALASEVEVLANAVRSSFSRPQSAAERIRQRAVTALDAEIEAALGALERNPGCARATQLVQANLERQAETLRALYAERSL
jgi:hypothetical protein